MWKFEENRLSELLRHIIEKTEYDAYLRDSDDEDSEDRISNVDELVSKITDYEENAEEPTLAGFLEEVALVSAIDETGDNKDRVLLMTLHSAKGLEFSHVYLTGMEDGVFPSSMALNSIDDEAEEEERRLAYVGITRAKDDLTLTYCRTRMLRGEVHYNPASRFLAEIPEELIDEPEALSPFGAGRSSGNSFRDDPFREEPFGESIYSERPFGSSQFEKNDQVSANAGTRSTRLRLKAVYRKPSTDESKKPYIAKMSGSGSGLSSLQKGMPAKVSRPDYQPGDRVRHVKYGEGTVKAIDEGPKDYKVTVVFDDYGQKVMLAAFAKLVKC